MELGRYKVRVSPTFISTSCDVAYNDDGIRDITIENNNSNCFIALFDNFLYCISRSRFRGTFTVCTCVETRFITCSFTGHAATSTTFWSTGETTSLGALVCAGISTHSPTGMLTPFTAKSLTVASTIFSMQNWSGYWYKRRCCQCQYGQQFCVFLEEVPSCL